MPSPIDIIFNSKMTGQQETVQQFSDLAKQMAASLETAFAQATSNIQKSMTGIYTGTWSDEHKVGTGSNAGSAAAPSTPNVSAVQAPQVSNPYSGAMNSPGAYYGQSLISGLPFTQTSQALYERSNSPNFGPNLGVDLAMGEARAIGEARRAGVNVDLTSEGRTRMGEHRDQAKEIIESSLAELSSLTKAIRDSIENEKDLKNEISQLKEQVKSGNDEAKHQLAYKESQTPEALMARRNSLQQGIAGMSKDLGGLNSVLGPGGGGMSDAAMAGAFAVTGSMAANALNRSIIAGNDISSMPSMDMLSGNYNRMRYYEDQGGYGGSAVGSALYTAVNPLNWWNFGDNVKSHMNSKEELARSMNPLAYMANDMARDNYREAFQGAVMGGDGDMEGFLMSGATKGFNRYGANRGVGEGGVKALLRSLTGSAGSSVKDMSDSSVQSLINLQSLGVMGAGADAGGLYAGGMDLDKAAAKLKEIYSEGVSLGIKTSDLPGILDRVASGSASGGMGAAGYFGGMASMGMGVSAGMYGSSPSSSQTSFAMSATASVMNATTFGGGSSAGSLAGFMGVSGGFNQYLKGHGISLNPGDLATLQAMPEPDGESIIQFVNERSGGKQLNDSPENVLRAFMQAKAGGAAQLMGMLGKNNSALMAAHLTGAKTGQQFNDSSGIISTMHKTGKSAHGGSAADTGNVATGHDGVGKKLTIMESTAIAEMTVQGLKNFGANLGNINRALEGLIRQVQDEAAGMYNGGGRFLQDMYGESRSPGPSTGSHNPHKEGG